jgi:hypothetical protein
MKKAVGDKYCDAVVAVLKILTRLIAVDFSLAIYTTFSHPDPSLKPYGYYTCLIMKQTLPVLAQPLHHRIDSFT